MLSPPLLTKCGVLDERKILGGNEYEFYIGFITDDEWKNAAYPVYG